MLAARHRNQLVYRMVSGIEWGRDVGRDTCFFGIWGTMYVMVLSYLMRSPERSRNKTLVVALVGALLAAGMAVAVTPKPANGATQPDAASLQVERLYQAYFLRDSEASGQNYWIGQRLAGRSLDSISDAFAQGPEFAQRYGELENREFVVRVYSNVLERAGEGSGVDYWTGELDAERLTRGEMMTGFSESAEFVLGLKHLDPEPVRRLYRAFFLRDGDDVGLTYWFEQQIAGLDLTQIAERFAGDAEFVTRYGQLDDEAFVRLVYQNVLERQPDAAGLAHWSSQLTTGRMSRGEVMVGFSEGPEFSGNPAPTSGSLVGGCQLFPSDSFWFSSVRDLPVHPQSATFVNTLGATTNMLPDFGAGLWAGGAIGIPFTVVEGPGPYTQTSFLYADESDPGPYPVPRDAPREHGSDHHILVVETGRCVLHEIFDVEWQADGSIRGGSGARWDLASNTMRPDSWTSSDAAGLPILPGLLRYDEVASGTINHAVRFTANVTDDSYVWPASHKGPRGSGDGRPPMGSWVRLKDSVDPNNFTGQARVIVEALQEHGAILADNGSSWVFSGAPDDRWDNQELRQLRELDGNNFEFVDASSLQVEDDSYEAR